MFVLFSYSTRQLSFTITIVLFSTYSATYFSMAGHSIYPSAVIAQPYWITNGQFSHRFTLFFFFLSRATPFFFSSQARAFSFSFELALTFFISLFLRTYKKFSYFIFFYLLFVYWFIDFFLFDNNIYCIAIVTELSKLRCRVKNLRFYDRITGIHCGPIIRHEKRSFC